MVNFELIFVWDRGTTTFIPVIIHLSQKHCWRDFFPHWTVIEPLSKINCLKIQGFILDTQSYSIHLDAYPYANSTLFSYCSFGVSFVIGNVCFSPLSFFFRVVFAILDLLTFNMNFSISLSISTKKSAGILTRIALNLYINLWSIAFS